MIGRPFTPNQAIVYRMLSDAAERGQYCPKNDEIAEALGAASAGTAGVILRRFEEWGLIRVANVGRRRQVCILETGQVTQ